MYLSRQAGKFVSFSLSVLKFVSERDGNGGDVEVHGKDEHGELGGDGADPERGGDGLVGGDGLGGGVGLGGSGERAVTVKDFSKITLFFLLIFDGVYPVSYTHLTLPTTPYV